LQKERPKSTFASSIRSGQSIVVSLLIDRRVQAALAVAVALLASVLLGSGEAAAGWSTSPG
jgi:hypothetical protein